MGSHGLKIGCSCGVYIVVQLGLRSCSSMHFLLDFCCVSSHFRRRFVSRHGLKVFGLAFLTLIQSEARWFGEAQTSFWKDFGTWRMQKFAGVSASCLSQEIRKAC